ncbi:MAG: TolC family protein [Gammaproteobacteria bacterium]
MKPSKFIYFIVFFMATQSTQVLASEFLSLPMAERQAIENDPLTRSFEQQAQAFEELAIAASQWPDPKLRFGLLSVPTDSFDMDQEPMTQLLVGYQQMLPRGNSLEYMAAEKQAMSQSKRSEQALRQHQVLLSVRKAWFQVYLQDLSEKIIRQNRRLFKQQLEVSQSLYAAGKNQQQDVLQAELELSLLEDQLQQIASSKQETRANLSQWTGYELAHRPLKEEPGFLHSRLPYQLDELISMLSDHPELKKKAAMIAVSREGVELARQKYKPQWGFDVSYGKRDGENMDGSSRADFISAIASIDLPVFTDERQDRELSAQKKKLQASRYDISDMRLQIVARLKSVHARWLQLNERLRLYDQKVLPQSKQNADAAMNGYQSGVVSFFTLTRARSAELKAQLQRLKLDVEKALAYAEIRFLIGEDN